MADPRQKVLARRFVRQPNYKSFAFVDSTAIPDVCPGLFDPASKRLRVNLGCVRELNLRRLKLAGRLKRRFAKRLAVPK